MPLPPLPPFRRVLAGVAFALATAAAQGPVGREPQEPELERLRAVLQSSGPDQRQARTSAVHTLLGMPEARAHAILQAALRRDDDADHVPAAILDALAAHLDNLLDPVFGTAAEPAAAIAPSWVAPLAAFWRGDADALGILPPDPLRNAARACLVRMPLPALRTGLRALAKSGAVDARVQAVRCAADSRRLQLGSVIAEQLDAEPPVLRRAARQSLRLLTFGVEDFQSQQQFEDWLHRHGDTTYLELAETVGRQAPLRAHASQAELERLRVDAAGEAIRLLCDRAPAIDWVAVQQRVLSDDPEIAFASQAALARALASGPPADDQAPARLQFVKQLLQRLPGLADEATRERALLLEAAACACRPEDAEAAAALVPMLQAQLQSPAPELQFAAVRGLRHFPGNEARSGVVRLATAALAKGATGHDLLEAALHTLAWRTPVWRAPLPTDPDLDAWLALLRGVMASEPLKDLRDEALAVALVTDAKNQRVAGAFDLLLMTSRDGASDPEVRATCLIHLQDWRDQAGRGEVWVRGLTALLGDAAADVRQSAAQALARLPDGTGDQQAAWLDTVLRAVRERLLAETNPVAVRAMADCLVAHSREPEVAGKVIGALNLVLQAVPVPVPPEQQMRVEALLQALISVAADPRADKGQWLGACDMLLLHEKRPSLRHVLVSHDAFQQAARDIGSKDPTLSGLAAKTFEVIVRTALQKGQKESWQATEELKSEAREVRGVFLALAGTDDKHANDPARLLLRLEVELAVGAAANVIAQGTALLASGPDRSLLGEAAKDQVRLVLAEAYLLEGKLELAGRCLDQRSAARAQDAPAVDAAERLARAYLATDPKTAASWFEKTLRGTGEEDPAFRSRFLAWAQAAVKADPGVRPAVLAQLERRAGLFEAAGCPQELKDAFAQLRGQQR